jgi:hypothetical protein
MKNELLRERIRRIRGHRRYRQSASLFRSQGFAGREALVLRGRRSAWFCGLRPFGFRLGKRAGERLSRSSRRPPRGTTACPPRSGQVSGFPALQQRAGARHALDPPGSREARGFPALRAFHPPDSPGLGRGLPSCGFFPLFSVICPGLGPTRTPLVKPRRGNHDWSPRASARGGHGQEAATR